MVWYMVVDFDFLFSPTAVKLQPVSFPHPMARIIWRIFAPPSKVQDGKFDHQQKTRTLEKPSSNHSSKSDEWVITCFPKPSREKGGVPGKDRLHAWDFDVSSRSIEMIGSGDFAKRQFRVGAHASDLIGSQGFAHFFWNPRLQGGFLDDLNPRFFFLNTLPFTNLKRQVLGLSMLGLGNFHQFYQSWAGDSM